MCETSTDNVVVSEFEAGNLRMAKTVSWYALFRQFYECTCDVLTIEIIFPGLSP